MLMASISTFAQTNKSTVKLPIDDNTKLISYNKVIDVIDYISVCLTARVTNVTETNELLDIYKNCSSVEDGYMAVLKAIKNYKDYKTK